MTAKAKEEIELHPELRHKRKFVQRRATNRPNGANHF
ncbi:hypothetical protein V1292_003246 [Bradyrhizobium sp. AZCC 1719]